MRISDWSSDVCSSDLRPPPPAARAATDRHAARPTRRRRPCRRAGSCACVDYPAVPTSTQEPAMQTRPLGRTGLEIAPLVLGGNVFGWTLDEAASFDILDAFVEHGFNAIDTADSYSTWVPGNRRSEEHTSELQSLMRISYAVFCLNKKTKAT